MTTLHAILVLIAGLTAVSVGSAGWVLAREALLRWQTGRAVRRLEDALAKIGPAAAVPEGLPEIARDPADEDETGMLSEPAAPVGRDVVRGIDERTLERALETLLRGDDEIKRRWARRVFVEVGMVERFCVRVREASRWGERAHAAEVLGLSASPAAVPALVDAIRDRHEDVSSVKLAATDALARMKDPRAVPLLVKELDVVDEHASPRVADALVRFGNVALPELLTLLGGGTSPAARVWAARVLGRIGSPAATDPLVARLADRNDMLRLAAAEALGMIGERRALQAVIQATLRDPAPQVRSHAAAAASKIAGEDAVDVLVAALSDPDYGTRLRALEAFEHIEVKDTAGLERALHDVNPEVKRRAALALERVGFLSRIIDGLAAEDAATSHRAYRDLLKLGSAGLIDSIAGYLHHASFEVRAQIATACGELAMARTGPLLVSALDDGDWPVRAALAQAIGRLRVPEAAPALARLLGDGSEVVREMAAEALAEYADEALVPCFAQIAAAYGPGSVPVRWQVMGVAARSKDDDATPLLVEGSRDPSERVRARAVAALAGREGAVAALVERLADPALEVRMAAVSALGAAATEEAFEGLVRALPGAPLDARERIAQALAKSAQGALLDRLLGLAASPELDVRLGISWALGKSGEAEAVPTLVRLLGDSEAKVRASAAGALGKMPGPATVAGLERAADDRDPKVRAAVVNALAKVAGASSAPVVEKRLADPDAFVRNRAAIALARVAGEAARVALDRAVGKGSLDDAPSLVAWSLVPGDGSQARLLAALEDPPRFNRVRAQALREDAPVCEAFHRRLGLEPPVSAEALPLDPAALVTRYERVLSEVHEVGERLTAVDALSRVPHDRATDVLADVLAGDPAEAARLRAAEALARRSADVATRRMLARALGDPSPEVVLVAIRAIGDARDLAQAAALHRRLGLGSAEVRAAVEEALARIHQTDVLPLLDRMMGEDRPEVLAASVRVLERMANPDAKPLLLALGRSREALVREAAVRALAALGDQDSTREIAAALEDPSELVRAAALEALARSKAEAALSTLTAVRSDPSIVMRAALARALGSFDGAAALRLLEGLADDVAAAVRAAVFASLLGRADARSLAAFTRLWPKAALDARHELRKGPDGARASDRLGVVLETSKDPKLRDAAVVGLAALAAPGWSGRVMLALRDPVPSVRATAVLALAQVEDDDVRARLQELLADPDAGVREAVKRAQLRLLG